ncbi:MAG: glycosyltransferase family 2 protein [Betaproteobacteria bacterium]|nr:MAG: glycosyltransferase family 2 protein [Betaproteobacteria bacterium]
MTLSAIDTGIIIASLEWLFVGYFLFLHGSHTFLAAVSVNSLRLRMESVAVKMLPRLSAGYEIPVSIIVPVSEPTQELAPFVQSLFGLDYPEFEVIVVIDTEDSENLSQLQTAFELVMFPEAYWRQVRARTVHSVYRSPRLPALRVLDKKPGGPGDAINAGINAARYPIVCIAHADSVLKRDSLRRLVPYFLEDASTIGAGTAEHVANGSFIVNGFLERCRLSGNPLVWMQATASLRRDLCSRYGWAVPNAMLTISDRFCAFRKEAVVQVGGCLRSAVNPILELVARLHRANTVIDRRYRIAFLPAPVLWRHMPSTPAAVCRGMASEHSGLSDALKVNRDLFWGRNSGLVGRLAFPFTKLTEVAGPLIELLAWTFFVAGFALDLVSGQHLVVFAVCAAGLGVLVSWLAILIDAFVFRTYQSAGSYALLLISAIFENAGFRQLITFCALPGLRPRAADHAGMRKQRPVERRPTD